ncbi:MAG: hypothetical protein ACJ74J_16625 [Blastocatellia bacterium]
MYFYSELLGFLHLLWIHSIQNHCKPEMVVRSLVHRMGYRYCLHKRDLPGKPDLVFPSHRKIIFVHGCFWHIHNCPYGKVVPKTNAEF